MLIAVTGASGYIATSLISCLLLKGFIVRGLSRSHTHLFTDNSYHHNVVDYSDEDLLYSAVKDVDVLIHTAALVHSSSSLKSLRFFKHYHAANVLSTSALVSACLRANVHRIIFLSSISVYGNTDLSLLSDTFQIPTPSDNYGISKLMSEFILTTKCKNTDTDYLILRIPMVYGKDSPGNYSSLLKLFDLIPFNIFSCLSAQKSFISISNLTTALVTAINYKFSFRSAFLLADPFSISISTISRTYYWHRKSTYYSLPIPAMTFYLFLLLLGKLSFWRKISFSQLIDSSPFIFITGWQPHPLADFERGDFF